jgi:integrase
VHLTRNGDAFVFQIRIPRRLDPSLTLSPIRLTLGAMPNSQARPLATALAGLAHMEFARRANALASGTATALRDDVSHSLQAAMPILLGLGALKPGALSPAVQDNAITAVFDALSEIGRQRAAGSGAFAREDIRFEKPFVEALRSENGARDLLGMPRVASEMNIDRFEQAVSSIITERMAGLEQSLLSRLGPAPGEWRGPLFSAAANKAIAAKIETHGADCSDISGLRLRRDFFIGLIGDRPVDSYTNDDMQRFANRLSWMPANLTKQQDFDLKHLDEIIEANKARKGAGLAENTILSYVGRVRTIIIKACNSISGVQHSVSELPKVPIHAAQPKVRLAPDKNEIGKVIAAGVTSGILSDALLPPLAILTGRRIGQLTFLRREQILRYNDTWCVFPVGTQQVEGVVTRVPSKTAASLGYYVLHDFFEDCGFIAWAKKADGPVFEHLMAAKDPADAAQKRMGRLYKSAGVDPAIAGTFHGLRSGKIRQERSLSTSGRALRIQVGHSVHDEHDGYDPVMTDEELQHFAQSPLPDGVDWSRLHGLDFEAYARRVPKGGRPAR